MIEAQCHCQAVRIEAASKPSSLTQCNCSICARSGALWAYYRPEDVQIIGAPGATGVYVWGDKTIAFHHCRICACTTHYDSLTQRPRRAVNARLMQAADIAGVPVRYFDGAVSWTEL